MLPRFSPAGLAAFLLPVLVHAQSVTILHGSSDVRDCSLNARRAAVSTEPVVIVDESPCSRALDQGDTLSPRNIAALHLNRGIIFAAQQQYQAAFADYKKAYEISPDIPELYVNLGNLYFIDGNLDRAIEFYGKSLELGLHKAHIAYLNRGMAREASGLREEAENDYVAALSLKPEWPVALDKLSALRNRMGEPDHGSP